MDYILNEETDNCIHNDSQINIFSVFDILGYWRLKGNRLHV